MSFSLIHKPASTPNSRKLHSMLTLISVVTDEAYIMELSRYIHLYPDRKQLVRKLERYEWRSYGAYIGMVESPCCLRTDDLLGRFGGTWREAFTQHKAFVETGKNLPGWNPFYVVVFIQQSTLRFCRLRYFRDEDWRSMVFYTYSSEKYEPCIFNTGDWHGTPEEAFDTSAVYLIG